MSSTRYSIPTPRVVHESIDGEVILIDFDSGSYFSLTGTGADLWALIEKTASAEQIVNGLNARYAGDRAAVEAAVQTTLAKLEAARLVEPLADGEATEAVPEATPLGVPGDAAPAFTAPVFQQFTDMQSLLLLDPIHDVDKAGWPHEAPQKTSEGDGA